MCSHVCYLYWMLLGSESENCSSGRHSGWIASNLCQHLLIISLMLTTLVTEVCTAHCVIPFTNLFNYFHKNLTIVGISERICVMRSSCGLATASSSGSQI